MITVKQTGHADPLEFEATVGDGPDATRHRVTMSAADLERLAGRDCRPERCIEAAFRFLLDREPKEAILGRFDVDLIPRYFPEFERELPGYLARNRGQAGPGGDA